MMRACGACFYFQGDRNGDGQCFNRPPYLHVVDLGIDPDSGSPVFEQFSLRPAVRSDEYCNFFMHQLPKPA